MLSPAKNGKMSYPRKPPAPLRLPVALLALALASGVPADDPDNRPDRPDIPTYVTKRVDLLVHEPLPASPDPGTVTEGGHKGVPRPRPGG
jgi:hypothetical protein